MARCLVIGGAGFIGSHLVKALLARGHAVRVLDNFSTGSEANLASALGNIELLAGDIADNELVAQAVKGVETIFHHAPLCLGLSVCNGSRNRHFVSFWQMNNVLTAADKAGVNRVIFATSAREQGVPSSLPEAKHSSPGTNGKPHEQDCSTLIALTRMETVRLRYFNVFGPAQPSTSLAAKVIGQAIKAMLLGRPPVVPGDGRDLLDFLYVDDVVHANLLAAEAPRVSGRVYNIGRGRPTTALEIVALLNGILGTNLRPILSAPFSASNPHQIADIARSEAELGFCAFTDLEKGLRHCVNYYANWRDSLLGRRDGPDGVGRFAFREPAEPPQKNQTGYLAIER